MTARQKVVAVLGYALPCVLLFAVHYNALRTWFFMDDFAWLGLRMEWQTGGDLWSILFQPRAQGTVRALSERLFFLVFSSLFGLKAGPFHYWVFATQCGSLVLASAIVRRLTGSVLAGVAAASLWAISPAIAVAMAWLSAYNEVLCGFLLLLAFYCLMRFVETGSPRFWYGQWAAYLVAFLALEVTVVYPAVALFYLWFAERRWFKRGLWLWVPSLLFTAFHFLLIPKHGTTAYKMAFDLGIVGMLGKYAFFAVGPQDLAKFTDQQPGPLGWWVAAGLLVVLGGFILWKRDWRVLMGVVWFCCLLGPVLPLQNHFSDYYATIASFGLAMLTGWAFQSAIAAGGFWRVTGVAAAGLLVWCDVVQVDLMGQWYRTHSGDMHTVLQGIEEISKRRPVGVVLLAGIDDELYISGMLDNPFRLYGIKHAYLIPGGEKLIRSVPRSEIMMRTDQDMANKLLADSKTLVASFDGRGLVDVTPIYRALATGGARLTMLRVSDKMWASRLGDGWYQPEGEFRWMKKRGTVELDAPTEARANLVVTVFCPRSLLDPVAGKLEMRASVDGVSLGSRPLAEGQIELDFGGFPAVLRQKKQVEVVLEMSHVVVPPEDGRELGAAVFSVGFRVP